MRICKNTSCEKAFKTNDKRKIYCTVKCRIYFNNARLLKRHRAEIFKIEHPELVQFIGVFQNSSIDAIRQLIDLKPLETKEANRYINLIEYDFSFGQRDRPSESSKTF